jgi:hypothetical protein
LLFAIVGFADVLQHTPLAVTAAPPSLVTFPPLDAEVEVIADIAVVLSVESIVGAIEKDLMARIRKILVFGRTE